MVKCCLHSFSVPTLCVINHGIFKISICLQCSWVPVLPQNSLSFQISLFSLHFINNYTHTAFGSSPLCTHILLLLAFLGSITGHPVVSFPASCSLALYSQASNPTPYQAHLQHKKLYSMGVFTNIAVAALL